MTDGSVTARARANIALVKYWGKRPGDKGLNLPAVGSLSITLDGLATTTSVTLEDGPGPDSYVRDGRQQPAEAERVGRFLQRIRQLAGSDRAARVETGNDFPTGAGLASSASGFAALAKAATLAYGLELDDRRLSMLARDGSGSAARSLFGGFVRMHRGERADGEDCWAEQLLAAGHWPLRVVVAITDSGAKPTGSTDGMRLTEQSSPYFQAWTEGQAADLAEAETAVREQDFERLAAVSEFSCLKMHASALAARPGVIYWNAATVAAMHCIRELRGDGLPVFFTIDAGPQLKAVCLPSAEQAVVDALESLNGVRQVLRTGIGNGVEIVE